MKRQTSLLDTIQTPADVRRLPLSELPQLCDELRNDVLYYVSKTGGHLAASLGVVEITVALHYVFDTPNDTLIWDVGHQVYPHKILTERRSKMDSLRQFGGLSGFPLQTESKYDNFTTGHSSTSISATLGIAIASSLTGKDNFHIAVIGDGALTAGMAYEALQHTSHLAPQNMLVILNDNGMSISENNGGLADYLGKTHNVSDEDTLNLFEVLGFDYTGVCDGHNVIELVEKLQYLKNTLKNTLQNPDKTQLPQLFHIKTIKGKGYDKAEREPIAYHGVSPFDIEKGIETTVPSSSKSLNFTSTFSHWIEMMAEQDERLVAITPAMREGSGLVEFSKKFPHRYFDVAIAEQHALTLAAGMSCRGVKPVVAIYSTFLQRAYDQLIHDIALQNCDVLLAVDRAGIVGEDGATHTGQFDIAFTRTIPNLVIMTPSNEQELVQLLNLPIGKGRVVRQGKDTAIVVFGSLLSQLSEYAQCNDMTLVDMRFVKPLDSSLIKKIAQSHTKVVVVEEGSLQGGINELVYKEIKQENPQTDVLCLGVEDVFICHGSRDDVLKCYQLDTKGLKKCIDGFLYK